MISCLVDCEKLERYSNIETSEFLSFSSFTPRSLWSHFADIGTKTAYVVCVLSAFSGTAHGGEIVFRPINPNFGGNPFNDGILLSTANAQNPYTAPRAERDLTEQFVRSLQSRLFSSLATQVQEAIFGDNPQDSGTFTVGDQQVSFTRGLEVITLQISNLGDGSTTVVEVPVVSVE